MRTGKFIVFFSFILVLVELGVVQHAEAQVIPKTITYQKSRQRSIEPYGTKRARSEGILRPKIPPKTLGEVMQEQQKRGLAPQEMRPRDDE